MNLENHLIQPAIVGRSVDLTPPTTMVAAFVGGAIAGVPGALVATPFVGAAKADLPGGTGPAEARETTHGRHPRPAPKLLRVVGERRNRRGRRRGRRYTATTRRPR